MGDGISFQVTSTHRYPSITYEQAAGADLDNFRFDDQAKFSPSAYDQIWLFGFASATQAYNDPS